MKKKQTRYAVHRKGFTKALLLMKLTIAMLLIATLQVSAHVTAQNISLNLKNAGLKTALKQIERKSSFRFLYNEEVMSSNQLVNIEVTNMPVADVLNRVLSTSNLGYKVLNNNLVVITQKNVDVVDIKVTGKITNANGEPVPGASVRVKNSSAGTSSSADGTYTLNVPDDATLIISSVGYEDQEIKVNGRSNIDVTLKNSVKLIDQVVVVGYGSQRKVDITGAVTNIKGEEIAKQASINPISALQGKVAGVQITNSGAPGASPEIRIRGVGTIYGTASPLYVVDGVWYNDISFLNTNDIESLSILKDASSEAIYGVRAANGVVLIATKKGRAGKPVVNYNGYVGYQHVTDQVKMANASEYQTIINELYVQNGSAPLFANTNAGEGTDWYHQILRDAIVTGHQVGLSGGTDKSDYNLSLSYLNQDGNVKTNNYERYTARFVNNFQILPILKIGYNVTGAFSKSKDIPGGIFHQLYAAGPIVPVYYADGTYGDPSDFSLGDGNNFNPQVTLDYFNQKSKNYRITGNIYADLKIAKHFTLHSSVGGEYGDGDVRNYNPVYTATLKQRNAVSILSITKNDTRNWILENTLTYDNKFGDHSIKLLAGQSAQRYKSYNITGTAQGVPYSSEGDLYLALGNTGTRNVTDGGSLNTATSYFSRLNYAYQNKYLLTASVRADAASQFFGGGNLWGYFPSVGAGWVVSKEKFMQNQKIFDNLKLRGSWGKVGNSVVPINPSVLTVNQGAYLTAIFGGQAYTGASVNSIVPPSIQWETGIGTDIGLEAAFLKNRLSIEVDYYNKKTQDAIFAIPVLTSIGTGSASIIGNQATFQNQGIEFSANWKDHISKDVNYSIAANISSNDNKVLEVATGKNPIYAGGAASTGGALATRTVLGEPIGEFYGYQVAGIFQNAAEVAASAQKINTKPGDFKYVDQNGDGVIDGKDKVVLGNPNPKYTYGISTNWSYKNFDLTVDFQGVAKVDVYNANLGLRYGNENFSKDFFDNRWHGEGTSNTYPSASIGGGNNYLPNSFYVEDGSYFRLRNLQVGYTIPQRLVKKWGMQKMRAYVNGQNIFTASHYRGFSPEVGGSPTNAGIDVNVYPLYATYNFGVNVTF
jgi:TonB-linked SusC/RagA family outer membrane protein